MRAFHCDEALDKTGLTGNSRSKGWKVTFALSASLKSVSNSCIVETDEPRKPAK